MQILIDIDEKAYDKLHNNRLIIKDVHQARMFMSTLWEAVKNGKPLPKGHGDLIDVKDLEFKWADVEYRDDERLEKGKKYAQIHDLVMSLGKLKKIEPVIEADKEEGGGLSFMGMRMHITDTNGVEYGDDHKFYGYYDYIYVNHSFEVIYPLLKEQWDYVRDECESAEEAYDYFKWTPYTSNLIVPEDIFKKFAAEYLADLIKSDKEPKVVSDVALYFAKLIKTPGDKVLEWC